MDELRKARFLAENFTNLQGLRTIPLGVFLIYMNLLPLLLPEKPHAMSALLLHIVLPLALALTAKYHVGRYYNNRFGRITYDFDQRTKRIHQSMIGMGLALPLIIGIYFLTQRDGAALNYMTLAIAFFLALLAFRSRWAQWPLLSHFAEYQLRDDTRFFLLLATCLLLWSLLPLVLGSNQILRNPGLPIGLMVIAIGLRTHSTFVAHFQRPEPALEAAV